MPVFILCILYALMAQRLYTVGQFHEIRWSKSLATDSGSTHVELQRIEHSIRHGDQTMSAYRHSLMTRQTSMPRCYHKTSTGGQSLNIHSMKKSAFKMLCKCSKIFTRQIRLLFHFVFFFSRRRYYRDIDSAEDQ
jgi:hypothetical protein